MTRWEAGAALTKGLREREPRKVSESINMAKLLVCLSLLLACLSLVALGAWAAPSNSNEYSERELTLRPPKEAEIKSDGGQVEVWTTAGDEPLKHVRLGFARIRVKERGLVLPKYADSSFLGYVLQGEGVAGLVSGYSLSETARRLKRGDVISIPYGAPYWIYNSGKEELEIVAISDSSRAATPGEYTAFHLAGAKEDRLGAVLHGFSKRLLADAWDVKVDRVEKLLARQPGVGIVRVEKDLGINPSDEAADEAESQNGGRRQDEFVFSLRDSAPEVSVKNGGQLFSVNRFKLPLLERTRLGANYNRLEPRALSAPSWFPNADHVVYFTKGSGRLEIVSHDGRRLLEAEVKEGEAYFQPQFFASIKAAGDEGLEWIALFNHDLPIPEALAGSTSVYKHIPLEVVAAAFNIDEDLELEFRDRRRQQSLILPPPEEEAEDVDSAVREKIEEMIANFVKSENTN